MDTLHFSIQVLQNAVSCTMHICVFDCCKISHALCRALVYDARHSSESPQIMLISSALVSDRCYSKSRDMITLKLLDAAHLRGVF